MTTTPLSRRELLATLSELLGIDVRHVQPAGSPDGKPRWRITVAERRVPVVRGRTDCGFQYARNVVIVASREVRNPRLLNRWVRSLGRPLSSAPLTAGDGHTAIRILHMLKESR
ncbi:MAG TPA: hypothetical protein VG650_14085 [Mycobacteriales bacterium]|nr:hypothetical protein [Mycobacteriales bacterium]